MGPSNALLAMIAQGAQPRMAEAGFRGYRQGNAMLQAQQAQADRNALAKIAQARATGGLQAGIQTAGQLGQYEPLNQMDTALYGRGRDDVMDQRDARNFGYRQQRDQVGDQFRNQDFSFRRQRAQVGDSQFDRQFDATQDYRQKTLSVAEQKAAAKSGKRGVGKPTVDSAKAAGFYDRMVASERALSDPRNIEAAVDRGNIALKAAAGLTPLRIGAGYLPKEFQKFDQAQRDFVNAILRRESGAVISDSEFANAAQQYFPQPGDTPEVIEQKAQNRAIAIEGIRRAGLPSLGPDAVGTGNTPDEQNAINMAVDAINRGADPAAVRQRLEQFGIDPAVLD
jgi:hypothetical protein